METTNFAEDLKHYWGILRRWSWLLALIIVLAAGTAFLISKRSTPIYQAVTTVLIDEAPATQSADYTSIMTSERLAQTYSQLMTKKPVLEGLLLRLGISMQLDKLQKAIRVQPVRDTTLIEVRVEDTDPQRAADLANGLVLEFAERNQELQASRYSASKQSLETQLAESDRQIQAARDQLAALSTGVESQAERDRLEANLAQYRQTFTFLLQSYEQVRLAEAQSTSNLTQAEPAAVPTQPVRPRTLVNTLLAAIVGLMLAAGTVFLLEAMDDTLKGPDQVTQQLGLPVLGLIASYEVEEGQPVTIVEPRSQVAEAFRSLRTNLQFTSVDRPLHTLLVTSPTPAEGKSTVAVNLGVVMAQSGRRVAVIDADLRRPRIHKLLGLPNQQGISNLFVQNPIHLDGTLQKAAIDDLWALTAGDLPPNPAELLASEKIVEIMAEVQQIVDLLVIDSPPVTAVTDSALLAPRVDGVLLVLKPGVTQMAAARQAIEQLRRLGSRLLGVVLNEVDLKRSRYYYYFKGYYYASNEYYPKRGRVLPKGVKRNGFFKRAKKSLERFKKKDFRKED